MKRSVILIYLWTCFSVFSIFCEEEDKPLPLSNINGGACSIVNRCVSAITGDYMESSADLVISGPEPLVFERFYASSDYQTECLANGWRHNFDSTVAFKYTYGLWIGGYRVESPDYLVRYSEPNGRSTLFSGNEPKKGYDVKMEFSSEHNLKGLTNYGLGTISGQDNLNNVGLLFQSKKENLLIKMGDGTQRQYARNKRYSALTYDIQEEKKMNGNKLKYTYNKHHELEAVSFMDGSEKTLYSSFKFKETPKKKGIDPTFEITGNDGQQVTYTLKKVKSSKKDKERGIGDCYRIAEVERSHAPKEFYQYVPKTNLSSAHICRREFPKNRFLEIEHYTSGDNDVGGKHIKLSKSDFQVNRVKLLKAPVGNDPKPIITHRFFYYGTEKKHKNHLVEILNGFTEVLDAYNHKTTYHYNKEERLSEIRHYTGIDQYAVNHAESLIWDNEGKLIGKTLTTGSNKVPKTACTIGYDSFGNVTSEKLYGDLTGKSPSLMLGANDLPIENGCDCFEKSSQYSQDGYNLLLTQKETNGKGYLFSYHPNTHTLASKLETDQGGISVRNFYSYNGQACLIKTITDDGITSDVNNLSGVTERKITYTYPRTTAPFGVPEKIEEKYLDLTTGQEKLLKCIVNTHSRTGLLLKQEHYDSNNVYQYALSWNYNPHGKVVFEQNALGEKIHREYDENDNLVKETGPNPSCIQTFTYDFSNRLINKKQEHSDSLTLVTSYRYDFLGNLIATTDSFGNETTFSHDDFGHVIAITYPAIPNEEGILTLPKEHKEYDALGNVTVSRDPQGNATSTRYNILGKPLEIRYPDGTFELFEYTIDGASITKKTAKNGTITHYTLDSFGRVKKEELLSAQNELLSTIYNTYNGFHLTSTIDAEGIKIFYQYDGAGRLSKVIKPFGNLTEMEYDSLGRVCTKRESNPYSPDFCSVKRLSYDFLDRVIEEITEDHTGTLLTIKKMTYDVDGNVISQTTRNCTGDSVTFAEYNSRKELIKSIDAEGNTTQITYDYFFRNAYNQTVLQQTVTDPLGNQTITTFNTLGKESTLLKKNPFGLPTAKQESLYDKTGNCVLTTETVFAGDQIRDVVKTRYAYNAMQQLLSLTEAVETPLQKITNYKYNAFGQQKTLIKPDGIEIYYQYDSKGRLADYTASDHSFAYSYVYDKNDRLTSVHDRLNNSVNERVYDDLGQVITEQLGNRQTLQYVYDYLGRVNTLTLSDSSQVQYVYNPVSLKEVHRLSSSGDSLYSHYYQAYDLSGNLLNAKLIGNCGELNFQYDACNRITEMTHPLWSQSVPDGGYSPVGDLLNYNLHDVQGETTSFFTYDDLYQLTSETGVASHAYANDSVQNRLLKDTIVYQVNALNQLTHQGETHYTYDKNGNLIQEISDGEVSQYTYDALDRLVSLTKNDTQYRYSYDSFNRRLSKSIYINQNGNFRLAETVNYLYALENEIGTVDSNGSINQLRVLGVGKGAEIGASIALELGGNVYAPIHALNGSVSCLLELDSGKCIETYRYSAYGEELVLDDSGKSISTSAIGNPWRFSSKRVDEESGLSYFGRRYYNSRIGRWVSPDPLGLSEGPNLYAYVMNRPLTLIDLYGLYCKNCQQSYLDEAASKIRFDDTFEYRHAKGYDDHSYSFDIGLPEFEDRGVGFINGIGNNFDGAFESTRYISQLLGGKNVHSVYNPTHGLPYDLKESYFNLIYVATDPVRQLHGMWDNYFNSTSDVSKFLMVCHSQGAIHVRNALLTYPEERRNRISVLAIAPAAYMPKGLCAQALHYRAGAERDVVPRLDFFGAARAGNTIVDLKSHPDAPLFDHPFGSSTYTLPLAKGLKNFISTGRM